MKSNHQRFPSARATACTWRGGGVGVRSKSARHCRLGVWLLFLLVRGLVIAAPWEPSAEFLRAVRYIESSNGLNLYGDEGRSLGDFQISEAAWIDVSAWRKTRKLPAYSYGGHVFNRRINRLYAANYLSLLYTELSSRMSRLPSGAELYAAYNMGLTQFAQCRYELRQVNATTQRKCRLIAEILGGKNSTEQPPANLAVNLP